MSWPNVTWQDTVTNEFFWASVKCQEGGKCFTYCIAISYNSLPFISRYFRCHSIMIACPSHQTYLYCYSSLLNLCNRLVWVKYYLENFDLLFSFNLSTNYFVCHEGLKTVSCKRGKLLNPSNFSMFIDDTGNLPWSNWQQIVLTCNRRAWKLLFIWCKLSKGDCSSNCLWQRKF